MALDIETTKRYDYEEDFTTESFRCLVKLAMKAYTVATYRSIPWDRSFVLWRHDCDFSLNRAIALAKIESEEGLQSTFFVNPHSRFYNLLETDQLTIVKQIHALGHEIGLHFDSEFYGVNTEEELHRHVASEANLLQQFTGIRPAVFSFHDPTEFSLACDADTYGGLINCYSKRLKQDVSYCSDSNGFWRFRRLQDVLTTAADQRLQVLTHPGWWQDRAMPARHRVLRAAYGRARCSLASFDKGMVAHRRENHAGRSEALGFLRDRDSELHGLCEYLWSLGRWDSVFRELWTFHERTFDELIVVVLETKWGVPRSEIEGFFGSLAAPPDRVTLCEKILESGWSTASGVGAEGYRSWTTSMTPTVPGRARFQATERDCRDLCLSIESITEMVEAQIRFSNGGMASTQAQEEEGGSDFHNRSEDFGRYDENGSRRWAELQLVLTG